MRKAAGDFEVPLIELEAKLEELSSYTDPTPEIIKKKEELEAELEKKRKEIYGNLTRWQKVLMARHPERPYTLDYIELLFDDFLEIHGDRRFADDPAIVGGIAFYKGMPVAVIGHQKGRDIKQRLHRNFGQAHPEGYRKALRIMKLAEKFGRPIISFVDTPGAFPGIGAEERGQAEAIAYNLREMAKLKVPFLIIVTGEGGSGGALGIGVGNRVLMLEYAIYSVISPEGCAAILWRTQEKKEEAAENLRLTAQDLYNFGVIDEIIPEPPGGAQANPREMAEILDGYIERHLKELSKLSPEELREQRYQRFRKLGVFEEVPP
ncbi:MAG: acetyl-CoA carboxylase carboxyltransferase subunit alpha [Acidobacteria bacterium]|nr:acetyl-CoA carboxylase carboxyltransferase subunit alpha [Acidobacteriota bacterium]